MEENSFLSTLDLGEDKCILHQQSLLGPDLGQLLLPTCKAELCEIKR